MKKNSFKSNRKDKIVLSSLVLLHGFFTFLIMFHLKQVFPINNSKILINSTFVVPAVLTFIIVGTSLGLWLSLYYKVFR